MFAYLSQALPNSVLFFVGFSPRVGPDLKEYLPYNKDGCTSTTWMYEQRNESGMLGTLETEIEFSMLTYTEYQ